MFIAALFAIAKTWKQPKCPLTDEWIKKLWNIYTMEYYSDIKRNASESVLMRWMTLEPIIQNEVKSETKTNITYLCIYVVSSKMVLMNLFAGQQWRRRHKEQDLWTRGGGVGSRRGWDEP